jgi:WD40 repeat protein
LAFAPDRKVVAVGGEDYVLRLIDSNTGKEIRRLIGHKFVGKPFDYGMGIWGVVFTDKGKTLVSWAGDATVRKWEVQSGKELNQLDTKNFTVWGVSPDGKLVATSNKQSEKSLRLWNLETGKEVQKLNHPADLSSVAFSRDGKLLAVASGGDKLMRGIVNVRNAFITLWDRESGKEIATFTGDKRSDYAMAFSPDGKTLSSTGSDGIIRLWDVGSRKERHATPPLPHPIYQLAFSSDGKTLVSRGAENHVRLWDVATWRERGPADGPGQAIDTVAYSPDAKRVASISGDRIWLWHSTTGKVVRILDGYGKFFSAVAFSADGKRLVSASRN